MRVAGQARVACASVNGCLRAAAEKKREWTGNKQDGQECPQRGWKGAEKTRWRAEKWWESVSAYDERVKRKKAEGFE